VLRHIVAAALVVPAAAQAGWSKPVTFPAVRARDTGAQLAINARGDAVARSGSDLLQITLDRDGHQTALVRTGTQSTPLATDAAGNLLVSAPYFGVTVRRPDGAEDPFVPGSIGTHWATTPDAAGFSVLFDPDLTTKANHSANSPATRLSLSFWRP
jgi:hypothetical protein